MVADSTSFNFSSGSVSCDSPVFDGAIRSVKVIGTCSIGQRNVTIGVEITLFEYLTSACQVKMVKRLVYDVSS